MSDLRQLVINYLTAHPYSTPKLIAVNIGERVGDVQGVCHGLVSEGLARMSFPAGALQPAFALKTRIGECENCGATDHHLVEGICPECQKRCTTVTVCGDRSFITMARGAFGHLAEGARLALANLEMPDDENAGDEAGVPREALR